MEETTEKQQIRKADRLYAEWLYEMYFVKDCIISKEQYNLMCLCGLIKTNEDIKPERVAKTREGYGKHKRNWIISHKKEREASPFIEVIEEITYEDESEVIENIIKYAKKEIKNTDWLPESRTNHTIEFVKFINSINNSYPNITSYKPFYLYCQQADEWFSEGISEADFTNEEELREYQFNEILRIAENTLYFAIKYCYVKDSKEVGGMFRYYAGMDVDNYLHARIRMFLFDCDYSTVTGKPRQITDSTIMAICAIKKLILTPQIYIKFITKDTEKGKELFRDKFKFVHSELPLFLREEAAYDTTLKLTLGQKTEKGKLVEGNSTIEVAPPSTGAINGGTPDYTFIDEADEIKILEEMIREGEPTLFKKSRQTGRLELARNINVWSTGIQGDNSKGAFERFYKRHKDNWDRAVYYTGIIPLFFNWRARCNYEEYKQKEMEYCSESNMRDKNMDINTARIQFNMHYPSSIDDMFCVSDKLLIPISMINDNLNRIRNLDNMQKPYYGKFEPIFDTSSPVENQDVPFKIIGATFKVLADDDPEVTTVIAYNGVPKTTWRNRYYAGTDTIDADTGTSKQSTAVYDAILGCKVALMNFRKQHKPEYSFLQSLLLTLYYDTDNFQRVGCKELIENNRAKSYHSYKVIKGFDKNVVYNAELPEYFWSNGSAWGIDNKGQRNPRIISHIREYYMNCGHLDTIDTGFLQLKTFEETLSEKKKESVWGTKDKRRYLDDVLFADAYAYICAKAFSLKIPQNTESNEYVAKYRTVRKLSYDKRGNLNIDVRRIKTN